MYIYTETRQGLQRLAQKMCVVSVGCFSSENSMRGLESVGLPVSQKQCLGR